MILRTEQIEKTNLELVDFDLVITASGYESRGSHLVTSGLKIKSKKNIALGFDNYRDNPVRKYNDSIFITAGYSFIVCTGDNSSAILNFLQSYMPADQNTNLNILVDYSCMTRVWYADILRFLSYSENAKNISLYFSYTVSDFIEPPSDSPLNKFVAPIQGYYSISTPTKPTALIIGLGYVSSRAFGLSEYFDVKPFLFINDSKFNEKFHNEVIKQNEKLIEYTPEENVFYYPLNNLTYTEVLLNHLCEDLLTNFRIVLAPCGPKPFTLICLLTSLRLDNVDVWRISAGEKEAPTDKKASGEVILLRCSIQN